MSAPRLEPLSLEDRAFLEGEAAPKHPRSLQARVGLGLAATFIVIIVSILAVLGAGLVARILGFAISNGAWRDHPLTFYGAFVIGGAVLTLQASSLIGWARNARRASAAHRQQIAADLKGGTVSVEALGAIAVKLLREPEHNAFIFLLRLSNSKTLVLYDYDSVDSENDFPADNQPTLVPCERISLRTFPHSGRRRWAFSGAPLPVPAAIELALAPDKWPEDESWCRVKWENIERHYGPKAGGQATASSRS